MSSTASPSPPTAPAVYRPQFHRKLPSFPMQLAAGIMLHGVGTPLVWFLERRGSVAKVMTKGNARNRARMQKLNPFNTFTPGPQDVVVMTFPKSGTNWMLQIALQLAYHGRAEFDHIHEFVPWPDTVMMPPFMKDYAVPLDQANDWETAPERRRIIKTHLVWDDLSYSPQARYIAVIRDPKDAFVSSYHFFKETALGPAMPSVASWLEVFRSGLGNFGTWTNSAAGYWAARQHPNVLVLSFKQMKQDLRGAVEQVAAFLSIDVPESVIDEVCRKSSFSYMKQIDQKFSQGKVIPWQKPATMIRRGAQGGSSEMLTPAQQRELDAFFIEDLKRAGSDLPYEEFADLAR